MITGHVVVNGQIEERPLAEHQGLLVREGTYDTYVIREIERSYGWLDVRGRCVLDIGANIGAFTAWAVRHGARHIVAVEPDPHNFELLVENFRRVCTEVGIGGAPSYSLLRYAMSSSLGTTTLWYPPNGKNHGALSTTEFRGRTSLRVETIPFRETCIDHNIQVVKCDCEGGEYEFLDVPWDIEDKVTQVAAEIHLSKRRWRAIQAPRLVERFSKWETVRAPVIGPKNWTTLAGWRRPEVSEADLQDIMGI